MSSGFPGRRTKGVQVRVEGEHVVITLLDRSLNFYVTDGLKEVLKETIERHLDEGRRSFIVDATDVKIVDSVGVGIGFIVPNNIVNTHSGELRFALNKPFIIKILEILRVAKHLSIFDTVYDALADACSVEAGDE